MKESLILIGLLLIFSQHVQGACENRLGTYRNLTVHDSNGIVLETITRCKDLVKNHPILCTREYGLEDGDCCKSCRKTDTSCIDNSLTFWTVDDQSYGCAEYVVYDPCVCEGIYTKEQCCKSCLKAVCPACRDYLSEFIYIDVFDNEGNTIKRLTDCDTLVNDTLYLCKEKYGQVGGQCCKSCSEQDLNCIDDTSVTWIVNDMQLKCKEYVKKNLARCYKDYVKTTCCKSCEEFCVDSGAKVTVELNIGTPEQKVTCNECSCSEIVAKGEEFTTKACRMIYVTTECCETCSNYK